MGDQPFESFSCSDKAIANLILEAHPISCFPASPSARASRTLSRTGVRPVCGCLVAWRGHTAGIGRRSARWNRPNKLFEA
jgi:hypothetical protein